MSSSLSAACSVGASNAGAQNCVGDGDGRPPPTRSTTTPSSTFKLRPRSKSLHIAGYSTSADDISPMKPHWLQAAISPHVPVFPSPSTATGEFASSGNDQPAAAAVTQPLTCASMFASGNKCNSPIKKQKIQDQQLRWQPSSPDSSISYSSEANHKGSPMVSASAAGPFTTATVEFPSSPPNGHASSNNSAGDCSSLPRDDGHVAISGDTSPFTPKGRLMMQKLCINSLTPPLTSACPTPDKSNSNSARSQLLHHQTLPTMPTFSFSPSLKLDGNFVCRNTTTNTTTADSSVRETIVFSGGSTPQGTPKRVGCPRASSTNTTTASASSSPFHSLRGQMTPIGHQRGSVFKTFPPRLYPMGRDDTDSIGTSVNNETSTSSWACSSLNSASPSPRVVPLTVLSRNSNNSSPAMSPKIPMMSFGPSTTSSSASNNNYPPAEPSPLMLSHGFKVGDEKDESNNDDFGTTLTTNHYLPSPRLNDIDIPNITKVLQSPLSTGSSSHRFLPRIKLTPRRTYNFAPIARDADGRSEEDGSMTSSRRCAASPTAATPSSANQASSSLIYSPGDKVAAEMDSLLNGFEQHKSDHPVMVATGSNRTTYHEHKNTSTDALNRVESEEAEMVALTQGHPYQMSDCRLRPTANTTNLAAEEEEPQKKCNHRNVGKKPMSSITLNLETSCHQHYRDATTSSSTLHHHSTSPSFLPRPMPMDQSKSRSLFDTSRNSYERILLADAIAEAARSNEPLTDDEDSDIDGDSDFLLCLPRDSRDNNGVNRSHSKSLADYNTEKQCFVKPSSNLVRVDSPSFFGCDSLATKAARNGTLSSRRKSGDQCLPSQSSQTTLTIYEDCAAMPTSSSSKRLYEGLMTKHGASEATFATYCSLSDCDASEILSSPKYFKMKAALGVSKERHSVCSLLSMSSLCGLDIVHETSQSGCGEQEFSDQIMQSISTESHDFTANSFRPLPLTRSEFSMNSLGLSLDSMDAGVDSTRDLFTPPMVMSSQNCKRMLSPPPLRHRPNNSFYHNRS
jgi:hypothetical protein